MSGVVQQTQCAFNCTEYLIQYILHKKKKNLTIRKCLYLLLPYSSKEESLEFISQLRIRVTVQKHILGQSAPSAYCLATKGRGRQQIVTIKIAHQ